MNMKLSQQSLLSIESTIKKAVARYQIPEDEEPSIVTDIHLQPNPTSGELLIYDDDDTELASCTINEWVSYESDDFDKEVERILTSILGRLKRSGNFSHLSLMEPYSFTLIDDDKETTSELLLVDSETLIVNDELLKGLDEELDAFLKDLLEK
jgi:hypothetical protein